jgi:starch synthase
MRPLHLALVWHLHQPYYKDDLSGSYLLPWVRLRTCKDYRKMVSLLADYPRLRQTFNLVPSLLTQIDDYARSASRDLFLDLSRKPAQDLSAEERSFLLRWMRESPRFLRVQASPRYLELANRSETDGFTTQDLRDLQLWYNLAWCDPTWAEHDPGLSSLKAKDRNFTEEDKEVLFTAQLEAVRGLIPSYSDLARQGQVELTFSPAYHPILPLLCDLETAREARPDIELPPRRFSHPEDGKRQLEIGREEFRRLTGVSPRGLWPPELAVAEDMVGQAVKSGVDWFLADEHTLGRSLPDQLGRDGEGFVARPELLYQPWLLERGAGSVTALFRDNLLSNRLGFDYHRMPARDAVNDFMSRLRRIREQQGDERDFLVVVALDGENAWDFYPREGHDFLDALYEELQKSDEVVSTTVSDFLDAHPHRHRLQRLHAGSWIDASLDTWVGDPEHNLAWTLLSEVRDWLEAYAREHPDHPRLAEAWRELYITEGSDWFWWFSRKHDSGMDDIWDNQFRLHLQNVYKVLDSKPPSALFHPVLERRAKEVRRLPQGPFTPAGPEHPAWEQAGRYEVGGGFGALHKPAELVERILYGGDEERLHVRIDSPLTPAQLGKAGAEFWLYVSGRASGDQVGEPLASPLRPPAVDELAFEPRAAIRISSDDVTILRLEDGGSRAAPVARQPSAYPLCFSVPFAALDKSPGEPLQLALVAVRNGQDVEHVPPVGALSLRVPRSAGSVEGRGGEPLRLLIAASEVAPFAKSGGVADVTAALAKELRHQGHDVRLVLPRYRQVSVEGNSLREVIKGLEIRLDGESFACSILEGRLSEVPAYFVDCPALFDREGMYGYRDDDARFAYLSRAAIEMLRSLDFMPHVIHAHDWQTALIPNLLDRLYSADPELSTVATVLTLHNLAFQGVFGPAALRLAGLDRWGLIRVGVPELDEVVNFLGRGIYFADVVNTVSERYAAEIQTPEYGEGLDELLRTHAHKVFGVVNGIDTELFDPAVDPALPHRYSAADPGAKALNKRALRAELGLAESRVPLVALISRFYEQKGLELVQQALPALSQLDVQLAVVGTGDRRYEDMFRLAAARLPGRLAAHFGFEPGIAQRLYAGADMLLMPSRFEPCGLGQLIALRYGTIPIVRSTGGLADTIRDFDPVSDTGYGFTFAGYDPWELFGAVVRAVETYKHSPAWARLVRRAMRQDVSWARSAVHYADLYRTAMAAHRDRSGTPSAGLLPA